MASIMAEVYGLVLMEIGIVYWGSEVLRVTSAYGDRYDGQWKEGEQHGKGVAIWADGDK